MSVAYNKFNAFVQQICTKKIDFSADTFKVMLSNTLPVATNAVKADITDISAGNGYSAGGTASTITGSSQTSGTEKVVAADVVFTASGGSIGPFQYAVFYDSTTNDLVGWFN